MSAPLPPKELPAATVAASLVHDEFLQVLDSGLYIIHVTQGGGAHAFTPTQAKRGLEWATAKVHTMEKR
jgi:hypothetical protein